jgi:hypothetical protein
MFVRIMDITPEIASEMLNKNTNNYRRVTQSRVNQYARKMELGFWQENGEPIQFSKDGTLLNGQHRLAAIIKSNTTQKMVVVYDVDADVFDSGKNRTLKEYSGINSTVGGAITAVLSKFNRETAQFIGNEERTAYYRKHFEQLDKSLLFCSRGTKHGILKKAGCVTAIYCALRLKTIHEYDLEAFCRIVNSGLPIDGFACESPLVLRKSLDNITNGGGGRKVIGQSFDITWQAIIAFKRGLKSRNMFKPNGEALKILDKVIEMDKEEAA